ncbi:hypothetical protein D8B26_002392 [Coccidioides posadasii str. Silveira]|uniref:Folliculin-interacting protein N-terminal domain-containing protein n=1 Tax=Coccidioides posadasii (strain C735) TaxID=222929 RepID=C5PI45_COCP7|nr:hypothetical protein CPC735_055680 [Coccidioides posadasii C735 delta SOWgp]EER24198.1 hypothetical protein CPC735_055680 [Coccidioides posadasii C735 delta SOWgp]QVM07700.1 hypothetical protein D8B26_002392 [Coccidioides posadasii str. Silveira]|eukprot:XP_003066343.1 hypothetical protein CPC735_055680 [Coccidioides posadasii C735 delta SOWgp]
MLGRLLNTAASAFNTNPHSPRNPTQLESVTEEEHTSGLLFPDVSVLQRSRTHTYPLQISALSPNAAAASSFDDKGGLDLDETKDFRIIIAQNAMGDRDEPCVLLDTLNLLGAETPSRSSQGSPLAETPRGRHSRTSSSSQNGRRHAVHGSQSSIPDLIPNSPFTDSRTRGDVGNMSVFFRARNRRSTFSTTTGEDYHQNRLSGDSGDSGLLNCIFGSSAFSYRASSTKMHIVPAGGESPYEIGNRSVQRPSHHQRAETFSSPSKPKGLSRELSVADQGSSSATKITVLVTRMFSVNLPEAQGLTAEPPEPQLSSFAKLFYYNDSAHYKKRKIKEKKTPMYAVAIAVQLPVAIRNHGRQYSPCGQDTLKPPGLISTSLDSDKRWHFASEDGSTYLSAASNLDERIDTLVDYWDIITRMLSHLEKVASKEILSLLKEADLLTIQRPKPIKQPPNMQRTNQTMIHLPPNSLAGNVALQQETLRAIHRVSLALKIPRVVTGQSRWGVWRDEARWIAKFLSEKEHNFFFLVLITAFLGNHTDWLGSLGPEWHKRRHILQQRAQQDSELSIPNRTVIISPCKMTARRLIFVLSAFLPAQQRPDTLSSPLRPSTSASLRQTSQSPPNPQFFRRESLRRTLNRRARTRNFVDEQENFKRSASVSSNETTNALADDLEFMSISARQIRRDSDVRSVKTASLPIPANSMSMRKSSTAIAAPAVPGTATPVPHFASQRGPRQRGTTAGQSENVSAASANLMQTLRRSESSNAGSTGSDYPTPSRWGSLLSNLWSSRETSSTAKTDAPPSLRRDETDSSISPPQTANSPVSTLVKMAGETDNDSSGNIGSGDNSDLPGTSIPHTDSTEVTTELSPEQQDIYDETPASPVKLCVEASDGVVDVEVPLPGFLSLSSSNDSTMASPRKTRTSITSIDGGASFQTDNYPCPTTQRDYERLNLNVAGWLSRYHEDFVLQAVRPYPTLEADVRRSMSAEPTPTHLLATMTTVLNASGCSEKWVDICSTLIADTTSSTVKRLRLRRKISSTKSGSGPLSPTITSSGRKTSFSAPSSASDPGMSSPIETRFIEEEFIEEPVMDLDGTLVDAVERVLAQSGPPSANHSRTASPNRGRRGRPGPRQLGDRQTHDASNTSEVPTFEVPRNECRRMVLGALEEVVRSVALEYRREESSTKLDNADIKGSSRTARKGIGTIADNTLREGIRRWLMDIEETC